MWCESQLSGMSRQEGPHLRTSVTEQNAERLFMESGWSANSFSKEGGAFLDPHVLFPLNNGTKWPWMAAAFFPDVDTSLSSLVIP